jgi:biotin carboxyl carrier protein
MATYKIKSHGVEYTAVVVDKATGGSTVTIDGREFDVTFTGGEANPAFSRPRSRAASVATPMGSGAIVAPIPGKIISICVKVGDLVSVDQVVLKLEAMKMENDIASPVSGTVKEIAVSEGSETATGQLLMTIG